MLEWNIQSRAHACQDCGRAFKDGETLRTLLVDARPGYERQDVCEACWQARHADGANHRRGFVSQWQSVYEPPPAAPPEPIQKDTAESLLRKLVESNDPRHAGAMFILAVMLERKRLLKAKTQDGEPGRRLLIYEHARTGDVFTIADPGLQLDQLEAVQRDVAVLLERGLEAVPPADAAASAATETVPAAAAGPAAPADTAPSPPPPPP